MQQAARLKDEYKLFSFVHIGEVSSYIREKSDVILPRPGYVRLVEILEFMIDCRQLTQKIHSASERYKLIGTIFNTREMEFTSLVNADFSHVAYVRFVYFFGSHPFLY